MSRVALLLMGLDPIRIGGVELWTREIALRLRDAGWQTVLGVLAEPDPLVRDYLAEAQVTIEIAPGLDRPAKAWRAVRRLVRRYRAELVHFQFTPFLSAYPWIARLSGAATIVVTDQGSQPEGHVTQPAAWWKRHIGRLVTAPIDAAVGVSQYNCNGLRTRGYIPVQRIHCIYNSVRVPLEDRGNRGSEFRRRWNIPADRVVAAQVSWMIPEKGIGDLIEAAAGAVRDCPALHFVLAGEGRERAAFESKVRELGLQNHVTFTGLILNPVDQGLFDACDILCQVSRWEEAFGFTIAEGMAASRPVVATAVGGIPELVEDQVTGYLVPKRDVAGMTARIVTLASDAGLRRRMGLAARAKALAEFEIGANVEKLLRAIQWDL